MAERGQKDLLARFADVSEEVLQRLTSTPGADRVLGGLTTMRDQVDMLAKRVRGMDALERRVEELERKVEKLSKGTSSRSGRKTTTTSRKTSSARRSSSRKKS